MNQNNRNSEILINQLAMVLEALEEYIREGNYYADWTNKEQFYNRTMPKGRVKLEKAENHFFSQFYLVSMLFFNEEKDKNLRQAAQKEFFKWIDHSEITVENCPERLKNILNEINEALENGDSRLYQAYETASKKEDGEELELGLDLKNPVHYQAYLEVNKELGHVPQTKKEQEANWPKYYEVNIKGNSEQGQATFQQIKNSIVSSQYEWTFPYREKYFRQLKEKIKELEEKKDQPRPKEEWKREINLEGLEDALLTLELYIQKLNCYPDWKISEWTKEGEDWRKNWENKAIEEIKGTVLSNLKGVSLMLRQFKVDDPHYYPYLLRELKTKFSQWKSERKINDNNCPEQLKEVLSTINEVLEGNWNWKINNKKEQENNEDKEKEIIKITVELKLELAELTKKYKVADLVPNDWQDKLMSMKTLSEVKSYQRQIKQKIQAEKVKHQTPITTDENKLSLPAKVVIGAGIIGLVVGTIIVVRRVIKNQKVKK